ncbi:PREDICTED: midasin-like [Branchiostoma belcheri]|uniref:Midasin-like n=1 Tax=Branchiostoma belcheri TaxID=7741 RepID=A0A6P4ZLB0_BRABE|nr:PREDICTED: midasin-like [Branchiostoma belcheri]
MFWSKLGKPREERQWEDSTDDGMEEQDNWNESGAYRVQDLGADKKALERPGDQGRVSWRHPGNDVDTGYTGYEPYQREKYPSPLEDMMEAYEPYEDEERYQERSSQPEWGDIAQDEQQDDDYETFLTRNERNDKILDALYEDQIPANAVDAADPEEEDDKDFDKYEKMAEALLREYPELATAAEKVLDEIIDEEDAEDAERREDGIFGDEGEAEEPSFEEEQQNIEDRAVKNPLEGYTHNNIDILQRKRLFQDEGEEEEEEGEEGGGDKDDDDKLSYYDILKPDDEMDNGEEADSDAEDPYALDDVYDANDEKKADVVEDYPDDYPDIPPETAEDEPRSPEAEDLALDEDRVEAFLDKVEDLLKATEAVSPPLCPVNVSDCHLIESGSPLSSGPYKEYFTAVCNRHEACYQCGSAHGISSSTCDRAMKYDLAEVCDMLAEVEGQDVDDMCKMKGEALHLAARLKRAYQETTVPECSYKCVMEFIVGS